MQVVSRFVASMMLLAGPAPAMTNVAIIDSGVDYKHKDLVATMWQNPTPGKDLSGKDTAYADDVNGWNFADNNNQVIDYTFLGTFPQDDFKYFEVQSRILLGTATDDDRTWYTQHKADSQFISGLEVFGNFVHGTHVSGIASAGSPNGRVMPIKVIATKPPQASMLARLQAHFGLPLDDGGTGLGSVMLPLILDMAAQNLTKTLTSASQYAAAQGAKVANGSFGVSEKAEEPVIAKVLVQVLGRDPTADETTQWSTYLVTQVTTDLQQFVQAAPDTLFCFAAGNDATDNDTLPAAPANDKADNTIAVAATLGQASLATFSNYGATMVEVAAPGVAIDSTVPGDLHMQLSGTSMAAPYCTNAAARVRDANPKLTPAEVKKILMATVDVKDFLKGKVSTSGIINQERAAAAAQMALAMPLDQAVAQALARVSDHADMERAAGAGAAAPILPLPNPLRLDY